MELNTLKVSSILVLFTIILVSSEDFAELHICQVCQCKYEHDPKIINCAVKHLKGPLENWTTLMKNLTFDNPTNLILTFNGNDMKKISIIPRIPNSTIEMSFVNCNVSEIQLGAFKNLNGLKYLDLSFNSLTYANLKGEIFRSVKKQEEGLPSKLEVLNLGSNSIHSLRHKIFKYTPKLKVLYLNDNPMNIIDTVTNLAISQAIKLEVLDLSRTGISKLTDDFFRNFKNLKELYLSGNKFTTVPESIGVLGNSLTYLAINENQITEINDNSFLGLWRLESLEISGMTTLKDVKANSFIQLKSLKQLHICNNPALDYISHDAFDGLKLDWKLKKIFLNNNNLRNLPKDLMPWNLTNEINLEENPWMCDCEMNSNLISGLSQKISKNTYPRCITPIELSGQRLTQLELKHVCETDNTNITISRRINTADQIQDISKINKILISFSGVVILMVAGIIVGIKTSQFRNNARGIMIAPVRYSNLSSA